MKNLYTRPKFFPIYRLITHSLQSTGFNENWLGWYWLIAYNLLKVWAFQIYWESKADWYNYIKNWRSQLQLWKMH